MARSRPKKRIGPALTSEQRSASAVRREMEKTPEQRSARALKGWVTRRGNLGLLCVVLLILGACDAREKERKEADEFNRTCLAEHSNDGDLCGQIWRATHPVGRGY